MTRGKLIILILAGALALGLGLWLGQTLVRPSVEPPAISGILFPEPKAIEDFTLSDQTGQPFHRDRFLGKWTFLYFGYTYCPDVCPLTLVELAKVQRQLAQNNLDGDTAYLLISVDPERDTPQRLGEYTRYFNPKFTGATGTPEELNKLARQFGVIYMRAPDSENKANYSIDHSSTVIVIDPDARLHAIFTPPHQPETMVSDFRKVRGHYRPKNN
ncbi:MAG: SCO family protein [Candidatus Contendobacter sp.]|nr:SCO family protein [Candidatus Contendobacter sp.]